MILLEEKTMDGRAGMPKMQQSGGAYPASHVNGAMKRMTGGAVPIAKRDYKMATPTYMCTPLTHQTVKVRSGR